MENVPHYSQEDMSICYAHAAQQLFDTALAKAKGSEFKPTSPLYAAYLYKSKNWVNVNGAESFDLAMGGTKKTLQYLREFGGCPTDRVSQILPLINSQRVGAIFNSQNSESNGLFRFSALDLLSDVFVESVAMRPSLDRLGRALGGVCGASQLQKVEENEFEIKERLNFFRSGRNSHDQSWQFVLNRLKENQSPVAASVCSHMMGAYAYSDEELLNCENNHFVVIVGYRILPSGHRIFLIRDSLKRRRGDYALCTEALGRDCNINTRAVDAEDILKMSLRFYYLQEN